ncbi:MAG TPA: DPP IV N-terminal domain-containing protein [Vicinamibacterales bacterium]|nr:DPP IV N-terminal domain-containing protein [Vicinamibacterales bacterium]
MQARSITAIVAGIGAGTLALAGGLHAQQAAPLDRLRTMPGVEQYTKMAPQLNGSILSGAIAPTWAADGQSFSYALNGKLLRFDVAAMKAVETGDAPVAAPGAGRAGGRGAGGVAGGGRGRGAGSLPSGVPNPCPPAPVERGRQSACAPSPDGKMKAFYKDRNIFISNADGSGEIALTTDGSVQERTKYGVGSWVYGEELGQTSAIWWSPDGSKVAFYYFNEGKVKDYYLQMMQTDLQSALDVEAYPKAGTDNPVADVLVYDLATKERTTLDVRDGKPFTNDVVGHYVYAIEWSPNGTELMMNRTNRRQQIMEFIACNPATTKCRVVVREEWLTGWTDNRPQRRWLADRNRFIWESERNGWTNYYLYDYAAGKLLNPITAHTTFEAGAIVKLDEDAGAMFYLARDGDNHMKLQLHRVGLDGNGDVRLTDPKFTHAATISPDNRYFVDVYQSHDQPAATRVVDMRGTVVAEIAKSDTSKFDAAGFKRVEMFSYKAADGKTTLYGTIAFPSNFDKSKKYATLVPVYGGPASGSNVPTENFAMPSANTEYGFLVVNLMSRAAPGMGRRTLDSIYMKLGQTEMDDMAEGIKALWPRPYFDKTRVGIHGSSYGGYTSAMEILRHPEVFTAASAASPVTSWVHYDTIYTERYMWIPQENKDGYDAGSAMTYAKNLRGRLLIYYGTADNNVHPNNSMQLIKALQQAGKSFEVQVGPDAGHSNVNAQRMMEFFIENLNVRPERLMAPEK